MKDCIPLLLEWYSLNKRNLPWRHDINPYHVWLSEIMLQQTRIEAVIPYYYRFLQKLPTIEDLALVSENELLKLWEGLGYYNRARNLKKAAEVIVVNYNGFFPNEYSELLKLPGVGEYTASAISSICFGKPEVTIDGNVLRVYMRFSNCFDNIDKREVRKKVREELMKIIPQSQSGCFNQALMELGETICLPGGIPKCNLCPLRDLCQGLKNHTFLDLPVRDKKLDKKVEKYAVLLLIYNDKLAICQRESNGLLANFWQFPMLKDVFSMTEIEQYFKDFSIKYEKINQSITYTHVFTHKKWEMSSFECYVERPISGYTWVSLEELLHNYPFPSAFRPFLENLSEKWNENWKK